MARPKYSDCGMEHKHEVAAAKGKFYSDMLPSMLSTNPRKFWKIVNSSPQHAIKLTDDDANPVPEPFCADVFNSALASAFTRESTITVTTHPRYSYAPMPDVIIFRAGIANITECLKLSSRGGPDNLNSKAVKMRAYFKPL